MPTYFEGDIVIAGISGRLPESSNIEEFKENLIKGTDMVTKDERRWKPNLYDLPSRFGKLKNLHSFDASFFKIPPKQAHLMDPQLRIMQEVTYEALIDAGINPSTLKKSHTGVFIGVYSSDASDFWKTKLDGHEWVRSRQGMIATRISYFFDLIGPSYSVDTLCSSSLTAMHQAIVAIRTGECDAAIVGGLNLVLDPIYSLHHHRMTLLSTDGKCKSFDISADGYVRAEAVVAIYLQKMTDARRVYATVVNTAINADGYKPEGIMHPSGDMQYLMLQKMYNEVNIDPKNVVYVEAHGTGTRAGDPEELVAIDKLFCKDRKTPLLIGSVKSNMGHGKAASGLCSIAKVLKLRDTDFEQLSVIFENIRFQRVTFLPENKTIKFFIRLLEGKGDFEIHEANTLVVSGNIRAADAFEKNQLNLSPLPMPPTELLLNAADIYKELRLRGYEQWCFQEINILRQFLHHWRVTLV